MSSDRAAPFVPENFAVPHELRHEHFRLEPLGPQHNDRDHRAWTSSIDHIRATPGFVGRDWPHRLMTLDENLHDLVEHARDFELRRGFTYSVIDGSEVIGCVYIYPPGPHTGEGCDADIHSWVTAERAELDAQLWTAVSGWVASEWPFARPDYARRAGSRSR